MLSNPSGGLVLPAQTGLKLQCPFRPTQMLENGNQVSSRLSREHLDPSPATPHWASGTLNFPLTEPVFGSSSLWRRYALKTEVPVSWVCHVLELSVSSSGKWLHR